MYSPTTMPRPRSRGGALALSLFVAMLIGFSAGFAVCGWLAWLSAKEAAEQPQMHASFKCQRVTRDGAEHIAWTVKTNLINGLPPKVVA